ncbi:transaldolase [Luedemannella flava]|uniref:Transaldolase n=1 Tax=Luedemannella flava TaxID=349316 RepID=A0ABN2LKE9_9ACTN
MTDRLAELSAAGVAVWLDDLSRARITSGGLAALNRDQHVVGVTTNPTIFAKALAEADDYADQLRELKAAGADAEAAVRAFTTQDVRDACDIMRPAYDASDGVDGRVSIEVDPRLAFETEKTIAEAEELWRLVDRENLFIKIPATVPGLAAISEVLGKGISVNVTLIFSLERYEAVMAAFLSGLELARANGHDLSRIGSVASFFVSRVDTEVDKRLDKIGTDEARALKAKAAIANAQLAYQHYERVFSTVTWDELKAAGAHPQRPLWASTSTKNPDLRDVMYVEQLVAPGTVNTMPEPTIHAYADHGETTPNIAQASYAQAQVVLDQLAALGIDYDDVVAVLEREGVEKFEASWVELLAAVKAQLEAV